MEEGAIVSEQNENDEPGKSLLDSMKTITNFSGIYGWVYSLFIFLSVIILTTIFLFQVYREFNLMDRDFRQNGKNLTLALANGANHAMKQRKYSPYIQSLQHLMDEQKENDNLPIIDEFFLLNRKGEVIAHSDVTLVTKNAKSVVSKISGAYNNEFFHNAILLSSGDVYVQEYPYETYLRGGGFLNVLKYVLPEGFFNAVDFSTPIMLKRRAEATLHIVMSRRNMDAILTEKFIAFGLVLAGTIILSLFLILFVRLPVQRKLKQLKSMILMLNVQVKDDRFKEEKEYIDQKIKELEIKTGSMIDSSVATQGSGAVSNSPVKPNNVKDAILLEEA